MGSTIIMTREVTSYDTESTSRDIILSYDKIKSCDTNEKLSKDLILICANAHV